MPVSQKQREAMALRGYVLATEAAAIAGLSRWGVLRAAPDEAKRRFGRGPWYVSRSWLSAYMQAGVPLSTEELDAVPFA